MFCRKCGQRIKDNESGCPHCGTKAATTYYPKYSTEIYYCKVCGNEADKEDNYCRKCGSPLDFSGIISDGIRRRLEKKRPPITRWEYLPQYPIEKDTEEEAEEKEADENQTAEEPFNAPPVGPEEEIPPETTEEPESNLEEETADTILTEENSPQEEPAPVENNERENYAENAEIAEETPYIEETQYAEESSNPDFEVTAPAENGGFDGEAQAEERAPQEEPSPEQTKEELINYSTDTIDGAEERVGVNPSLTVTKPRPVKERQALGIIAVIFAILFPPAGIILGIAAVSKGWNGKNGAYTRLGTTAIVIGVAMTILLSLLAWKVIIPIVEDYIKSRQTVFLTLKNL